MLEWTRCCIGKQQKNWPWVETDALKLWHMQRGCSPWNGFHLGGRQVLDRSWVINPHLVWLLKATCGTAPLWTLMIFQCKSGWIVKVREMTTWASGSQSNLCHIRGVHFPVMWLLSGLWCSAWASSLSMHGIGKGLQVCMGLESILPLKGMNRGLLFMQRSCTVVNLGLQQGR